MFVIIFFDGVQCNVVSLSVSVLVYYSVTASVSSIIIGNQAINLYGVSEASEERKY